MQIKFVFPGEPKAIQSVKFARRGDFVTKYQPKKNTDWKAYIKVSAQSQLQKLFPGGFEPIKTQIIIRNALFVFSPVKSLKAIEKRAIARGLNVYKITRPDLSDNLFKGVIDALTGILYKDDALICKIENSIKVYGNNPRIELEFEFHEKEQELF